MKNNRFADGISELVEALQRAKKALAETAKDYMPGGTDRQTFEHEYFMPVENALASAAALIERACAMEWRPIETAPKCRILLGRLENGEMRNIADDEWYQDRISGGWDEYAEVFQEPPTHWMHIPTPTNASAISERKDSKNEK